MIPLAVFGDPIRHSLSPQLHQIFAHQTGLTVDYRAILAPPETFTEQLQQFFSAGGIGANVTLPHKVSALEIADQVSPRARLAGAANTLHMKTRQGLYADNTDGEGLVNDLRLQGAPLTNQRVLILGAGGAVRGIVAPLLEAGVAQIVVNNRTLSRAQQLVTAFHAQMPASVERLFAYTPTHDSQEFDIVIHAAAAGHHGQMGIELKPAWLKHASLGYDLSYGKAAQPFLTAAAALNPKISVVDGLGMLVAQGAASFYIWTGAKPDSEQALAQLRQHLVTLQTPITQEAPK